MKKLLKLIPLLLLVVTCAATAPPQLQQSTWEAKIVKKSPITTGGGYTLYLEVYSTKDKATTYDEEYYVDPGSHETESDIDQGIKTILQRYEDQESLYATKKVGDVVKLSTVSPGGDIKP